MNTPSDPPIFSLRRGHLPLLISMPHIGKFIPDAIAARMTDVARYVDDCDWHLERLYAFAAWRGASIIAPTHARYVIDLNRPPDDTNLYPGQDTTGLLPADTFDKLPLYRPGCEPTDEDLARRRARYWQPYHEALAQELAALKAVCGKVLLWEAHSIRSHVPRFFEGRLPDFNFGTAGGTSAAPGMAEALAACVSRHGSYRSRTDGLKAATLRGGTACRARAFTQCNSSCRKSPICGKRGLTDTMRCSPRASSHCWGP
jgi:N-formylglutamate deformylase